MASERDVENFTFKKLMLLINEDEEKRKADLAMLRHGLSEEPGTMPALSQLLFEDMPADMAWRGEEPGYAEWAIYIALTVFAMHQQGKDINEHCMYKGDYGLGKAMAMLVENPETDRQKVMNRFNTVAMSTDVQNLAVLLRAAVRLLKGKDIPLDYVQIAGDIYEFQFEDSRSHVQLKWGRDFYYELNKNGKKQEETATENQA